MLMFRRRISGIIFLLFLGYFSGRLFFMALVFIALVRARFVTKPGKVQCLSAYAGFLQNLENLLGHILGQINGGVVVKYFYLPDMLAFNIRLVGNCADNFARLYLVTVSEFQPVALHSHFGAGIKIPPVGFFLFPFLAAGIAFFAFEFVLGRICYRRNQGPVFLLQVMLFSLQISSTIFWKRAES